MADELKEIITELLERTIAYINKPNATANETIQYYEVFRDQCIAEIKSLLKSKLPKKIPIPEEPIPSSMGAKLLGYNQALTEIEKIVEEL